MPPIAPPTGILSDLPCAHWRAKRQRSPFGKQGSYIAGSQSGAELFSLAFDNDLEWEIF